MRAIAPALKAHLRPGLLVPSLAAGSVAGMLCIMAQTSFAVLIFAGELSPYVARGLGVTLLAAAVMNLVVAFGSSLPGTIANPQDSPAAILAVSAAAMAASMPAGSTAEELLATVLVTIALMSLLAGVFFLLLGWFRQGGLVRYIPYPVVGGFLAGVGWLLVQGSVGIMAGLPLTVANLPALLQPDRLLHWLPGLAFAVVTLLALRRWNHFLLLPGLLLAAIALFYLVAGASSWLRAGVAPGAPLATLWAPLTQAGAPNWLLGPFPEGGLWQPLTPALLQQVHWPSIVAQASTMGIILVVSVVSLLLNASGLELLARRDVDLNRELKAAGVANLLAGLGGGGPVGYQMLSISSLGYRLGAPSRLVSVVAALFSAAMLLLGPSLLTYVPRMVPGGLILFLGLAFLAEWLYDTWPRLSRIDYAIVVLILMVTMAFGILEGVGLGLAVSVLLFVLEYSRLGAVRRAASGSALRSNVDRPPFQERLLREKSDWLFILELQGYLFFGTAHSLLQRVRDRLAQKDRPRPRFVLLDFRRVSGMDVSAVHSFARLGQLALPPPQAGPASDAPQPPGSGVEAAAGSGAGQVPGFTLVFTGLSPRLQQRLERELPNDAPLLWQVFPDLDHGLEWCEEQIVAQFGAADARPSTAAGGQAGDGQVWFEGPPGDERRAGIMGRVMAYMERLTFAPGEVLIRQGEPSKGLYFIDEGQVTIRLEGEDGDAIRLRTRGPGNVVGEIGLYLGTPATASVVVHGTCTVYRLSPEALRRMEADAPELASDFHRTMASHLSDRLASTTEIVQALLA